MLVADASALAQRRLLDGHRLRELRDVNGYRNLAFDLFMLAAIMREAWPRISSGTSLQVGELEQAELIADKLLTAVGRREQGPAVAAACAQSRQRAFALFVAAYDDARQALTFLRRAEGDVDEIAPPLDRGGALRRTNAETPADAPRAVALQAGPSSGVEPAIRGGEWLAHSRRNRASRP